MATRSSVSGLFLAALAAASACAPAQASTSSPAPLSPAPPTPQALDTTRVTVTGNATVDVPADRARLRVGVMTERATAAEASSENAEIMERVLQRVRGAAGAGARIETSGYQVAPQYSRNPGDEGGARIVAYRVMNQLVVTLEELERVGPVLDAAMAAGSNQVAGLSFFASDTESARLEAIRTATARARTEAEAVAQALGLSVLRAESVQTSSGARYRPQMEMASMAMRADTPVEPGSDTVDASVTITWILGPGGGR